jgi:uncharacterized protein
MRGSKLSAVIIPVVIGAAVLLIFLKHNLPSLIILGLPGQIELENELAYQLTTLILALLIIGISFVLNPSGFRSFFKVGQINAKIQLVKYLGINPKPNENWFHLGRNFLIIISLVTIAVIYFQVVRGNNLSQDVIQHIPWIILFSLINSFVEEMIFRFSLVSTLHSTLAYSHIAIISGIIFGIAHYFGTPGGILGILVAGFIGWFLAKSMLETRGLFWAWIIHFVQDVIIFTGIFAFKIN